MNNILSFNEYNGYELETIVYENELNEGIRNFLNKQAAIKIRAELADEIEMSKTIMDGIREGLDSLNDNFDTIKKSIADSDNEKVKGKKQKTLDEIIKILENSRKNTWELNELIDEGEIDYAGFTANVGIASVAYFGILFTPFRAMFMVHKGYNYFFNIIKNTIRKSLVMLQLNFDQFENLVITKGFQSADYLQASDSSDDISQFYGNITAQLFGDEGKVDRTMGKKKSEQIRNMLKAAKDKFDQQMKADKLAQQAGNAYNCLDQYNNTYTRSLETLRQYSQDDIQKHLDSIKASMSKLAGQEADLQTYSELIIAAAEEHAYKVSSSIYNKFAKMTEVFSLPNQKKMIDLILAADKEHKREEKKLKKERDALKEKVEKDNKESAGTEVFKSLDGVELGEPIEDENGLKKYDPDQIKADNWTWNEFKKKSDDEKDTLEGWLNFHPEVLDKCDESLQIYINTPFKDSRYIDSLVDYIGVCLGGEGRRKNESTILNFKDYIFESSGDDEEDDEKPYELSDEEKAEIDEKLKDIKDDYDKLIKLIFGKERDEISDDDITDEVKAKLDYVISKNEEDGDDDTAAQLMDLKKELKNRKKKYYIDLSEDNIDDRQFKVIKKLYNKKIAPIALVAIGRKVLKDNTFVKNSDNIVSIIKECVKSESKKKSISFMTYNLLKDTIEKLKDIRNHDYSTVDNNSDKEKDEK